jgi:IS1 family transposase
MNKLSTKAKVQILSALSEGMGVKATSRVTGASKNTILKLVADVGAACAEYQNNSMRNLKCTDVQIDEIWSFVGAKERNVRDDHPEGYGDCYTYTTIDRATKLMPCWLVGVRSRACAFEFIADVASRMANRISLTTDGFGAYRDAVDAAFNGDVDYAMLNKSYEGEASLIETSRRYSPAKFVKATKEVVNGNPDHKSISTSQVERSNLSLRMSNRRFTRLTNAFSKKLQNHMHAVSFYFMVYNYVKIHSTIKTTPAMEAGVTDLLWDIEDIVLMAETMRKEVVTSDHSN